MARRELFRKVVSDLVSDEPNLHAARLADYVRLVRHCAVKHPEWTAALLRWARHDAGLDYTARAGAAEFLAARLAAGQHGMSRQVIDSVLVDPLDPTWLLSYWNYFHGRALPKPLKRGIGDAVRRLYTEQSVREHDHTWMTLRFGDVLSRVHPKPVDERQSALFRSIIDRRYDRDAVEAKPLRRSPAPLHLPVLPGRTVLFADRPGETVDLVVSRCEQAEIVWHPDDLRKAVRTLFRRPDRVVVITDELGRSPRWSAPWGVPLHVWDLSDHDSQWASVSRRRYRYYAKSSNALRVIPLFEAGEQGLWPW